ncbi:MAG: flagellar biosynthetic protein FliO [Opitutales bacterium]|nr:flagellar biosynthetic protein FliO [Opitutales bacterium]
MINHLQLLTATDSPDLWPGSATSSLLPIILLFILAVPLVWILWRKRMPRAVGGNRKLNISESCMVGPRQFIIVASYENERILIGVSPGQINYLCKVKAGEEPATTDSRFEELLTKDTLQ